ncbi:16S rRNA (cytidine(1402)-2'-O)-methyltransferase [Kangiella profundi]|uniref:Ribosomal RNA small subunit methyltransferase I n=1 Tax=Kangiella profundi TaxID=1561924 RepID=A0A2K9AD11_9GAMM|nr:16S rRNA (cytidine(1402)-2'-O)-methyltransferase [Kangiella profundi]AUD78276.1 16S rRNA (cytidine(1402)-2'-O)-methyltransferase [Kangiella profundi]GGF06724.1 ribosomal RNA small subunit methyltransferase I [Kangiella profundi]
MAEFAQSDTASAQLGILYVVATPIGNIEDISARAIRLLKEVDLIFAEDTRHSQRLMQHYAIDTQMMSLHEHNEVARIEQIAGFLQQGKHIALISDAGTPLISDPGFKLVREIRKQGFRISPVPGASAIITALSVAGLATDSFSFWGFLPAKSSGRKQVFSDVSQNRETLVFYESSHRILDCLKDLSEIMGSRELVIARELTKTFETILTGTASSLAKRLEQDLDQQKGEFVLMVSGSDDKPTEMDSNTQTLMAALLDELPPNKAAKIVAKVSGLKKKVLYQWALEQKEK